MDMSKMVQVKGYEGYYFDEDFNIWSFRRKEPKMLKPSPRWRGKGSRQKHLRVDIDKKKLTIHRLVYQTFKGEIPPGMLVRHLDDNEHNNHPDNLEVGTHFDNSQDSIRNGTKGKINKQQARELLQLGVHFTADELAEFYGLKASSVRNILNGHSWKQVDRTNLKFQNQKEVI